jgi:hypothetical protein
VAKAARENKKQNLCQVFLTSFDTHKAAYDTTKQNRSTRVCEGSYSQLCQNKKKRITDHYSLDPVKSVILSDKSIIFNFA